MLQPRVPGSQVVAVQTSSDPPPQLLTASGHDAFAVTVAPGRTLFGTHVDQSVQEGSGGDDEGLTVVAIALVHDEADYMPVRNENATRFAKEPRDVGFALERVRYPRGVAPLVRLCPWRPNCRPAAAIQQPELDAGGIDRPRHQAAERVDFSDQMSFGRSTNCRIARHVCNRVAWEGAQPNGATESSGGKRGFNARVSRADHNHVETHVLY